MLVWLLAEDSLIWMLVKSPTSQHHNLTLQVLKKRHCRGDRAPLFSNPPFLIQNRLFGRRPRDS